MKKIRGVFDRIEDGRAVIKSDGREVLVPKEAVGVSPGEAVVVTVSSEAEDAKNSNEIAKDLLREVLEEA